MSDGSVIIDVEFNTDKARKQYQQLGDEAAQQLDRKIGKSKAFNSLSEQSQEFAKKAALGLAAASTAVLGFSIKAAGDMAALEAQFDQVFEGVGDEATKSLGKIADETHMLPNRLKGSFTQMAAFAKTTGMNTADALSLTERATLAAADSAAFYDRSIEDVTDSLQSFLKGNFENDAALGISATETTRNTAANKLYGKSFKDLDESQKQLTLLQMVEDGNKLSGALGQAAREANGFENVMGNMKQALTDLAAAFGAPLLDPFLNMLNKISGAMSKFAEKLRENPALVYVIIGAVTTLVAALGGMYVAANAAKWLGMLKTVMLGTSSSFGLLTNPIGLVILAIGALVTAFVYFYKTSDTFRAKVDGVVKNLKSLMAPVGDIVEGIKLLATAFKAIVFNDFSVSVTDLHDKFVKLFPESLWKGMTSFAQKTKGIVQGLGTLAKAFKAIAFDDWSVNVAALKADFLEVFPESLWNGMTKLAQSIKVMIGNFKEGSSKIDVFGIAFKVLKAVVLSLLGPVGLFIKALELIAKVLGGGDVGKGIDKILDSFDGLATGLQKNGPKIGSSAGKAIEGILKAIAQALPGIITGGLQIIAAVVTGIAQGLPTLALAAVQLIAAFTATILMLIPTIAASGLSILIALTGALVTGIPIIVECVTQLIVAFLLALTENLPQIIVAGGQLIVSLLAGITEQLPTLIESAANLIVTWLTALTEHLPDIIVAGMELIVAFLDGIAQKLPDLVVSVANLIVTFLTTLAGEMPGIVAAGADLLIKFLDGLASKMPDIVAAALNLVVKFLEGIASKLRDVVDAAVDVIVAFLQGIADNIRRIVDAGMDIVEAVKDGILDAQDRLFKIAISLINGLADNIRKNRKEMKDAGENLLDAIIEGIPGNGLVSAGFDLIMGLAQGIGNAAGEAIEAAKSVASDIYDRVTGFFDIHSPSRLFRDNVGAMLPKGIGVGIKKGAKSALKEMDSLSNEIIDKANISDQVFGMKSLINGTLSPERASNLYAERTINDANRINRYAQLRENNNQRDRTNYDDKPIEVTSNLYMDSKEIAYAVAPLVESRNALFARRKSIMEGNR